MRNFFSQNPHPKNTHFLLAVFAFVGFLLSGERALAQLDYGVCESKGAGYECLASGDAKIGTRPSIDTCIVAKGTATAPVKVGQCYSPVVTKSCADSFAGGVCKASCNTGSEIDKGNGAPLCGDPAATVCCVAKPTESCGKTYTGGVCKVTCGVGDEAKGTGVPLCGDPAINNCCAPKGSTTTPTTGGGTQSIAFENPLKYNTVQDVFGGLLTALRGVLIILALIFIVIGALLYITSAGDQKQISIAKAAIYAALIGLAIALAAPSFLKEIYLILDPKSTGEAVSAAPTLAAILLNVLNFLLGVIGILALIMLIIGALTMISSTGDEKQIDGGKSMVKYAIIGIAIAFASLILIKQIAAFFVG
jgi:hypothetical protein